MFHVAQMQLLFCSRSMYYTKSENGALLLESFLKHTEYLKDCQSAAKKKSGFFASVPAFLVQAGGHKRLLYGRTQHARDGQKHQESCLLRTI